MKIPKSWSNPHLILYHGTHEEAAEKILNEVDVKAGRAEDVDFGRGFYTTTNKQQAEEWTSRKLNFGKPVIVAFTVPRLILANLKVLFFARGDETADDYWSFVTHCRKGIRDHAVEGNWYDVVVGPLSLNFKKREIVGDSYDQVSFHTVESASILNKNEKEMVYVE